MTRLTGASALGALLVWATWPLETLATSGATRDQDSSARGTDAVGPAALQRELFDVELWTLAAEEPLPASDQDAQPSAPPLSLRLVGITIEEGVRWAALYDPTVDRLHLVKSGDELQGHVVSRVAQASVMLTRGRRIHTLELREDR